MQTAEARRIIEAARAHARQIDRQVSILVLDAAGLPVLLDAEGEPPTFTRVVADGKAMGAIFMGRDSGELAAMAANSPAFASALAVRLGGRFVPFAGAVLLRRGGEVIGAVGVSGASAEEDEEIAKAGAATLAD